jgi:hypothetical protein
MSESTGESRLRIKFGEHEFEASGPSHVVENYLEAFRQLVSAYAGSSETADPFHKVVLLKGRTASLKVATKPDDSILLLLLAQKQFRSNDSVSGAEIMNGLRQSGVRITRGDYILGKHASQGYVSSTGSGRKRRYRLTDAGVARAQQIVQELLSLTR